jgi:hypothetical protein
MAAVPQRSSGAAPSPRHRWDLVGPATALGVGAVALLVALFDWRDRGWPWFDLLPYYWAVDRWLSHGEVPVRGTLTGFASYAPPGIAWLLLPGAATAGDPRLSEYAGATLLSVGTLLGVYYVARPGLGSRWAALAVVLYGLSTVGLFFAGSLWPRAHPVFLVWMAYWLQRWVLRREPGAVAAALLIWVVGMYAFMELAPALLVAPVLWLVYRPPVRGWHLAAVAVAGLVVWAPYLRFQADRGFADLVSQLGRRSLLPPEAAYRAAYCDPAILVQRQPLEGAWLPNVVSNFGLGAPVRGAGAAMLLLCLAGMAASWGRGTPLVVALALPWGVLLALTAPGRPERFWVLWPLQAIFLAAGAALPLRLHRAPRPARRLAAGVVAAALVGLVAGNATTSEVAGRWLRAGWPGAEPDEVRALDYVAAAVRASGGERVALGYQLPVWEFMASYHVLDLRYKVGADLDYLLLRRHGIANTDRCAEGVSAADEFRLVEDGSGGAWRGGPDRFLASSQGFRAEQRIGRFVVLRAE